PIDSQARHDVGQLTEGHGSALETDYGIDMKKFADICGSMFRSRVPTRFPGISNLGRAGQVGALGQRFPPPVGDLQALE
ncbi:MAG: hypothetical protein WBP72_05305, partial [Rhodocyclaceae bacterium]